METVVAVLVGLGGGAVIGFILTWPEFPEGAKWIAVFVVVLAIAYVLGVAITPASGPEVGIIENVGKIVASKFGAWTGVAAIFAGIVVGGLISYWKEKQSS